MPSSPSRILAWFRRDLRSQDHTALAAALDEGARVWCGFIFDREILDALPDPADRRVEFIHASVAELQQALEAKGGGLVVRHGVARAEIPRLALEVGAQAVYFNHDDDPAARARDTAVEAALTLAGVAAHHYKDAVIFEREEVLTGAGKSFSVFTPYKNA
ncbi:MAG: deoxyribodipyrimidine photo-lyase, partial [Gammaproteobacteria bacterium]